MKIKAILIAITIIAMLALPASAGTGQVTVPNWEPFMFTNQAWAGDMYSGFIGNPDNVYFAGTGVVAISEYDQFIIQQDDNQADVRFYAVAGDWNGRDTLELFEYNITYENGTVFATGTMESETNVFGMPFKICKLDKSFFEAGKYHIKVTATDDGQMRCYGNLDFWIYDDPKYIVSDLYIDDVAENGEVCGYFNVTNVYGVDNATIAEVYVDDILGDGMEIPKECINVSGFEGVEFSPGETIRVNVCIDSEGYELAHGTSYPFSIAYSVLSGSAVDGQWTVEINEGYISS